MRPTSSAGEAGAVARLGGFPIAGEGNRSRVENPRLDHDKTLSHMRPSFAKRLGGKVLLIADIRPDNGNWGRRGDTLAGGFPRRLCELPPPRHRGGYLAHSLFRPQKRPPAATARNIPNGHLGSPFSESKRVVLKIRSTHAGRTFLRVKGRAPRGFTAQLWLSDQRAENRPQ